MLSVWLFLLQILLTLWPIASGQDQSLPEDDDYRRFKQQRITGVDWRQFEEAKTQQKPIFVHSLEEWAQPMEIGSTEKKKPLADGSKSMEVDDQLLDTGQQGNDGGDIGGEVDALAERLGRLRIPSQQPDRRDKAFPFHRAGQAVLVPVQLDYQNTIEVEIVQFTEQLLTSVQQRTCIQFGLDVPEASDAPRRIHFVPKQLARVASCNLNRIRLQTRPRIMLSRPCLERSWWLLQAIAVGLGIHPANAIKMGEDEQIYSALNRLYCNIAGEREENVHEIRTTADGEKVQETETEQRELEVKNVIGTKNNQNGMEEPGIECRKCRKRKGNEAAEADDRPTKFSDFAQRILDGQRRKHQMEQEELKLAEAIEREKGRLSHFGGDNDKRLRLKMGKRKLDIMGKIIRRRARLEKANAPLPFSIFPSDEELKRQGVHSFDLDRYRPPVRLWNIYRNLETKKYQVPYFIHEMSTEARFWIKLAMRTVEENTCLEFVQFDPIGIAIDERFFKKGYWQKGRARKFGLQTQYIQFRHGDGGCYSNIGRLKFGEGQKPQQPTTSDEGEQPRKFGDVNFYFQEIVLTPWCATEKITIIHEIFHALGLPHFHSASNRDQFFQVIDENITEDGKSEFRKLDFFRLLPRHLQESIMIYPTKNQFAREEGACTIATKDGQEVKIPTRVPASDWEVVNLLYQCHKNAAWESMQFEQKTSTEKQIKEAKKKTRHGQVNALIRRLNFGETRAAQRRAAAKKASGKREAQKLKMLAHEMERRNRRKTTTIKTKKAAMKPKNK